MVLQYIAYLDSFFGCYDETTFHLYTEKSFIFILTIGMCRLIRPSSILPSTPFIPIVEMLYTRLCMLRLNGQDRAGMSTVEAIRS